MTFVSVVAITRSALLVSRNDSAMNNAQEFALSNNALN
jgi:hypothetical protein